MSAEDLERLLVRDLDQVDGRFVDEDFCRQLYRALTNNRWSKRGGPRARWHSAGRGPSAS